MRVPAGPTDWSWRTRTRRPRGKSAVDSDVVDATGGHPVDARSRVDIRADDVPDGINAADHAAGLSSSLDNLAASVERCAQASSQHGARRYGDHPCRSDGGSDLRSPTAASTRLHVARIGIPLRTPGRQRSFVRTARTCSCAHPPMLARDSIWLGYLGRVPPDPSFGRSAAPSTTMFYVPVLGRP